MKVLIGADLVPTETNTELFAAGDVRELVGDALLEILRSADLRVFNLELPLTDKASPIAKNGPTLIAPTAAVAAYKALGVDWLTAANNHIMDQGIAGLESTRKVLEENSIGYLGIGDGLAEAAKPRIVEIQGKKLGIYACVEHEFSVAEEASPGANPFDPLESPDHVAALKAQCDFVIVLYHGGKEHYRYPSPGLQKTCRKLVEKGADLVLCQHSHCVGCEEKYLQGTIVYGQGNFLFDHSKSEFWQTGLLVQLGEDFQVSYIPLCKKENVVRLALPEEAAQILEGFASRSEQIKDGAFLKQQYDRFAETLKNSYLLTFSSINYSKPFYRALNKLSGNRWVQWYLRRTYKKDKLLAIRNYVECEAHRELLLAYLQKKTPAS